MPTTLPTVWNVLQNAEGEKQLLESDQPIPEGWSAVAQTANPDYLSMPTPHEITVLAFRRRLTPAERVAMDSSPDNPALPAEIRALARTMLIDLSLSEEVNLNDPDVIAGVELMVSIGILTQERAAAILG